MRAGDFPELIRFEQRAVDDNGDRLGDWVADPSFETAAGFTWLRSGEAVMQSRLQGLGVVVIRVRTSAVLRSVTTAFRVLDRNTGDTFAIRSKIPDRRRRVIDFTCETGGSDA